MVQSHRHRLWHNASIRLALVHNHDQSIATIINKHNERCIDILMSTYGTEGLHGEPFTFFKLGLITRVTNDWYRFSCMNVVWLNSMSCQISNWLDIICFAIQLNFVRVVHFMHSSTNVANTNIDTNFFDTSIGSFPDSFYKLIKLWIKVQSKGRITDTA